MARVVVGLSGGVDSSVAALLLKQQGHEVIGLFMRNWNDATVTLEDECPWIDDSRDAMMIAEQLNIPFQVLDLSYEYKQRIVDYMFDEYAAGRTPNPDVLCNREIKFDLFLEKALALGAEFVATGHYVQKDSFEKDDTVIYRLLGGADPNKDQSYFLCQLNQKQLSKALFPIGHLQKNEVREIAKSNGLITAEKKDSQGLCFIGKVSLPDFLQQQLKSKPGKVIEIPTDSPKILAYLNQCELHPEDAALLSQRPKYDAQDGIEIGKHNGAHFYTIGQRKGLQIGGKEKPLFVLQTDVINNLIFVGQGEDHPGLYSKALEIEFEGLNWIRPDLVLTDETSMNVGLRIRYRQAIVNGTLKMTKNRHFMLFDKPLKGVTPGQFVAWYTGNEEIGSGVIH